MRSSFRRRVTRCGAPWAGALFALGCSLQNFESLSRNADELGATGGAAGNGSLAGAGGGGAGGSAPGAGGTGGSRGGSGGAGGADVGGSGTGAGTGGVGSGDAGANPNLLNDPGFEVGHAGWVAFGGSAIIDVDAEGRDGSRCISSSNRTATFEGPSVRIDTLVSAAATYSVVAWVRASSGNQPVSISLKTVCDGTPASYLPIVSDTANATSWTQLVGHFTAPSCVLSEFSIYIEGPPSGISFYVDDVAMYLVP
jgi:hypothetical protein